MKDVVLFKKGLESNLPEVKDPGTLYFCTDTGNIFFDIDSNNRIQIKDSTKLSLSGGTISGNIDFNLQNTADYVAELISNESNTFEITLKNLTSDPEAINIPYIKFTNSDINLGNRLRSIQIDQGTVTIVANIQDNVRFDSAGITLLPSISDYFTINNVPIPQESNQVSNKQYVDEQLSTKLNGYLPINGGTLTGILNMGNHKIQNVSDPTSGLDAANKDYVDASKIHVYSNVSIGQINATMYEINSQTYFGTFSMPVQTFLNMSEFGFDLRVPGNSMPEGKFVFEFNTGLVQSSSGSTYSNVTSTAYVYSSSSEFNTPVTFNTPMSASNGLYYPTGVFYTCEWNS